MTTENLVNSPIERSVGGTPPQLIAISGPLSGDTCYLDEPVVSIGRRASNNIHLKDPFVSRHHCVIKVEGDEYMIDDLDSANGTYVDGERVKTGSLKEGSVIGIGISRFMFLQSRAPKVEFLNHRSTSSDQVLLAA